jgi:exonuclease VII small subunit
MMSMPTTRVNLEQLQQAVRQLEDVKRYLESHCVSYMPAITRALGSASNVDMSDAEYQFTREATVFGGFYSAYGMQAKNDGVYRAVDSSLRQLITHLDTVIANMQTIIGNYQAAEETATQSSQDFERQLTSPPVNPGGPVMYA